MAVYSKIRKSLLKFNNVNPYVNFLYYIGVLVVLFLFNNPLMLVSCFVISILIAKIYCEHIRVKLFLIMGISPILLNPIFVHRGSHILFYLLGNPVTLEAILYGLNTSVFMMTLFLCFSTMNVVISSNKFIYIFTKVMPRLGFMLNMSIRYVDILSERATIIKETLTTRGFNFSEGKKIDIIKSNGKVLESIIKWTLEEGLLISESLRSKGYASGKKRTYYKKYNIKKGEIAVGGIIILFIFFFMAMSGQGVMIYDFYKSKQLTFSFKDVSVYVATVLFFLIPLFYEIEFFIRRKQSNVNN